MKVYIAGLNMNRGFSEAINYQIVNNISTPYMLESFHYVGKPGSLGYKSVTAYVRGRKESIFLDSGAFSMFTQGIDISIEDYAAYIKENLDVIHIASNLDDVQKNEQISYTNQKKLEDLGCKVQPVFHCREDPKWLVKYMQEGYDYIFIGGMVPETTEWLREWLDGIWQNYLTDAQGRPLVKVHGFGLTTLPLMERYPWYSVDSASWVMASSFGSCYMNMTLEDGQKLLRPVCFSNKSPSRKKVDRGWHFDSMSKAQQERVREYLWVMEQQREKLPGDVEERLEEITGLKQGYYVETLAEMYGWRRHINIKFFEQFNIDDYGTKTFRNEQPRLFE